MNDPTSRKESKPLWVMPATIMVIPLLIAAATVTACNANNHRPHGKSPSLASAHALESAINNFYTEYGDLPYVGNQVTTDTPDGLRLLNVLLGLERDVAKHKNTRNIKFLSVKIGKDKRNGLIYTSSGTSVEGLYDLWGNPYAVVLDADFDEHLQFNYGAKPVELKGRHVAIYSPGKDKKAGTSDDIKTW